MCARGAAQTPSAILAWNPDTDPTEVGFRLYYGTSSGQYSQVEDVGNATTATISGLSAGVTYYFVVTAYNSSGLESLPSSEVSFTVPIISVSLAGVTTGAIFNASAVITLTANAVSGAAQISEIEFYDGSSLIGTTNAPPFSLTWSSTMAGNHLLTVVAIDAAGNQASSTVIPIQVVPFGITSTQLSPTGVFSLTIQGAPGRMYQVYASSDLQNWTLMTVAVNSTGTLVVNDPNAGTFPQRFYTVVAN